MLRLIILLLGITLSPLVIANGKILVFGDSLSAGFGLQSGESWVDLLEQRIINERLDYKVINASISGDTTDSGVIRLTKSLQLNSPQIVILELGANDGLRGLSLETMRSNLAKMIDACITNNARVLLVGMQLPPNYGVFFNKKFSSVYKDLATEKNIPLVPFLLAGFETDLNYFQADKIHPNASAQQIVLENVWLHLKNLLHH